MNKRETRKITLFLAIGLLVSVSSCAQDTTLTGYWQGAFNSDHANGRRETYFLNMMLLQTGRKVEGRFSNSLMDFKNYPQVVWNISGLIGKKDQIPTRLMRGKLLYSVLSESATDYFLEFDNIHYFKNDTIEVLYGNWSPNGGLPRFSGGVSGTFWVRKLLVEQVFKPFLPHDSTAMPPPGNTLSIINGSLKIELGDTATISKPKEVSTKSGIPDSVSIPKAMTGRKNMQQGDIVVNTKQVSLQLYDNGIVDDDSVSVFFNGKLLLSHQLISETPITLNIELDENNPKNELILFAENLGRIPPNTALIIVTAGDKRFELFSKTDMKENAVLLFRYQPK